MSEFHLTFRLERDSRVIHRWFVSEMIAIFCRGAAIDCILIIGIAGSVRGPGRAIKRSSFSRCCVLTAAVVALLRHVSANSSLFILGSEYKRSDAPIILTGAGGTCDQVQVYRYMYARDSLRLERNGMIQHAFLRGLST